MEKEAGFLGLELAISGLFGSALVGFWLDRTKTYAYIGILFSFEVLIRSSSLLLFALSFILLHFFSEFTAPF